MTDQKATKPVVLTSEGNTHGPRTSIRAQGALLGPIFLAVLLWGSGASAEMDPRNAVVKVFATQLSPNYTEPWRSGSKHMGIGSGFVITGQRIITNAHVVSNATFIQVRRYGDAERVPARILSVSDHADLALLTVDRPGFFDAMTPLDFGSLPDIRQEVAVLGFPIGGDTLSVTRGVVSRIEHQVYVHTGVELLAGQIDSAVNPGNSGGPVLVNTRTVGVAMQTMNSADNISYMIPTTVVRQFLADVADGSFDGLPHVPFRWQRLEAEDLRRRYDLLPPRTGILILDTTVGSAASRLLLRGDVLLSIDGHAIGTDGTIEFRRHERTSFRYLIERHQLGDSVMLGVLRAGRALEIVLPLDRPLGAGQLVAGPLYDRDPSYYVVGGLVFCPVTVNYLRAWGKDWWSRAPRHLMVLLDQRTRFEEEQAVVLCDILADDLNTGYDNVKEDLIVRADGQPVRNLSHLVEIIETSDAGLVVLETQESAEIVIDRVRARQRGPSILERYRVLQDRSDDLASAETISLLRSPSAADARGGNSGEDR